MGTLWDSINLALSVALLVVALAALHTSKHWTQHKQRNATMIHNAKRERNSYTTPHIVNKPSGLETPPPPATYAVSPSSQETPSKQITLKQETQTHNYSQHTDGATPVGVAAHSPNRNNSTETQANKQHKQ
jgi:hypothetical protein